MVYYQKAREVSGALSHEVFHILHRIRLGFGRGDTSFIDSERHALCDLLGRYSDKTTYQTSASFNQDIALALKQRAGQVMQPTTPKDEIEAFFDVLSKAIDGYKAETSFLADEEGDVGLIRRLAGK